MSKTNNQFFFVSLLALFILLPLVFASGAAPSWQADQLIAHWPLIGGLVKDLSTNGNHGILHGTVLRPDRFGNEYAARGFLGANDYIDIGKNVKPPLPVTVSAWVKIPANGGGVVFRNDQNPSGYQIYYGLWMSIYGRTLYAGVGSGWDHRREKEIYAASPLDTNLWHQIAAVFPVLYEQIEIFLYVDGQQVPGEYTLSRDDWAYIMQYHDGNGIIGADLRGTDVYSPFRGSISDLRVYNRALSPEEILGLYNVPNPNDVDSDDDGFSDYAELVGGTNPCNPSDKSSYLKLHPAVELEFPTRTGTTNLIQASADLVNWWDVGAPIISNGQLIRKFFRTDDQHRFFRIRELP